jgi:hypothetical protein
MTSLPAQPSAPIEDVTRGTVLALLAIPAGIIVFVLIWSIGFIASAVTLGVAFLARFLYLLGSGGVIGRAGAVRVTVITISTVIASIIAGLVSDVAIGIGQVMSISPIEALMSPQFSTVFAAYVGDPDAQSSLIPSVLLALGFGALGCFSLLRGTFRAAAAPAAPAAPIAYQHWPQNSTVDPFAEPNAPVQQQPFPPAEEYPQR